jgi:hypothetical protein
MTIAEVRRRYGIYWSMVRRMIEFGWVATDGKSHKLKATRTGRRWDVSQRSLDQWAADTDAATLAWALNHLTRTGGGWFQLSLGADEETLQSFKRLAAAGHFVYRAVHCRDSHVTHATFFRVGHPEGEQELASLDAMKPCRCKRMRAGEA